MARHDDTLENLDAIHYLAQLIHDAEIRKAGYAAATRWWCTNEEVKQINFDKAVDLVNEWKSKEIQTRDQIDAMFK